MIFYENEAQREAAERSKQEQEAQRGRIYTEILPIERFYLAEEYHQDYYEKNGFSISCPW